MRRRGFIQDAPMRRRTCPQRGPRSHPRTAAKGEGGLPRTRSSSSQCFGSTDGNSGMFVWSDPIAELTRWKRHCSPSSCPSFSISLVIVIVSSSCSRRWTSKTIRHRIRSNRKRWRWHWTRQAETSSRRFPSVHTCTRQPQPYAYSWRLGQCSSLARCCRIAPKRLPGHQYSSVGPAPGRTFRSAARCRTAGTWRAGLRTH
jgi:hypothetical protein